MTKASTNRKILRLDLAIALMFSFASTAHAGFTDDLAQCVSAPIEISTAAAADGYKAASFVINHSDCVPNVVALDPILIGMTAGVVGLQNAPTPQSLRLPIDADQCTAAIFSVAKKPVAGMIAMAADSPPVSFVIPLSSKNQLLSIANGASDDSLYQVPGVSQIAGNLSCACAVAETGSPVDQVRDKINIALNAIKSAGACGSVLDKLWSGGYDAGKEAASAIAGAISNTLASLYGSFSNGVKKVGCSLGLGGCSSSGPTGPPYFCTGYMVSRTQGYTREELLAFWTQIFSSQLNLGGSSGLQLGWAASTQVAPSPPNPYEASINNCEDEYQKALAEDARKKLLLQETEKAEKLADAYALGFAFAWSPKCMGEPICQSGISHIADQFGADLKDAETLGTYGYFASAVVALDAKYASNAQFAVAWGQERRYKALRDNAFAPVAERLPAFGCRPFLGRQGQSLCDSEAGFNVCKQYVRTNQWKLCASSTAPNAFYSGGAALVGLMRGAGCILIPQTAARTPLTPNSNQGRLSSARGNTRSNNAAALGAVLALGGIEPINNYQCISASAYQTCMSMQKGGSPVNCGRARPIMPATASPVVFAPNTSLPPNLPTAIMNTPTASPPMTRPSLPPIAKRPAPPPKANTRKP